MMNWYLRTNALGYGWGLVPWLFPLIVLDIVLRGLALWRSARNNQPWWFVFLLIVNSLGILPAVYLIIYRKKESRRK